MIFTFGVGSLLDLPNMSVLIMGLDDWDTRYCTEISEERLLANLQKRLGPQLKKLFLPPVIFEDVVPDQDAPAIGVPVSPFPRWLRCPVCDTLATIESGVFQLRLDQWRPDRTCYVHTGCTKVDTPTALSVRFLLACRNGHLTDFPWIEYVHQGIKPCKPARLTLREYGAAGDASDIIIKCLECNKERRMGDAFDKDRAHFTCLGHHPHLRIVQPGCQEPAQATLLGASNSWFPLVMSVLSIPRAADRLSRLVEERWADPKDISSLEIAQWATAPSRMPHFVDFSAQEIWDAIQSKKLSDREPSGEQPEDIKQPEWEVLSSPSQSKENDDFKLREVAPPQGFERFFENTVLVERLREVRSLLGFTRIESKGDFVDAAFVDDGRQTPLCRNNPTWLPASEVRGEGIFIRLNEQVVETWEARSEIRSFEKEFFESHRIWRRLRKIEPHDTGFPGIRFVLVHSLSHALMRQIVLDCGYTAASVRERIYCRSTTDSKGPMAGILLYTAASDSEGTLGGLVNVGNPLSLGRHIQQCLEHIRVCASDPLCSEHRPSSDGRGIHAASCHACLFAPETSCERGNRYLDRTVLVPTFSDNKMNFFED